MSFPSFTVPIRSLRQILLDIKLYDMNILAVKYHQARAAIRSRFPAMTQRRTDPSAIHTWLVLMKAHRTLSRHATRSIEPLDMSLSDFAILQPLLPKGPHPVLGWAPRTDVTRGS